MALCIVIEIKIRRVDSTYILRVEFASAHQHGQGDASFALMHTFICQTSSIDSTVKRRHERMP
jgi:hypothetical protein